MFLPKGVQIQPKIAPAKDTLALAVESIMDPIQMSDVQVVPTSRQPQVVARKPHLVTTESRRVAMPVRQPHIVASPLRQPQKPKLIKPEIAIQRKPLPATSTPKTVVPDRRPIIVSPVKLSEPLTVSEPRPTIPSTVPDDFLEDSSFSEITSSDMGIGNKFVSASPAPNDDPSTRRSGRERKMNSFLNFINNDTCTFSVGH